MCVYGPCYVCTLHIFTADSRFLPSVGISKGPLCQRRWRWPVSMSDKWPARHGFECPRRPLWHICQCARRPLLRQAGSWSWWYIHDWKAGMAAWPYDCVTAFTCSPFYANCLRCLSSYFSVMDFKKKFFKHQWMVVPKQKTAITWSGTNQLLLDCSIDAPIWLTR